MRDAQAVLRGPFDPATHKETFVDYFEAVVRPDGLVEYAVPSHQEKLMAIYRESGGDPLDDCPTVLQWDYLDWLMVETGCVCLWSHAFRGEPNARQRQAIRRLCAEGLMRLSGTPGLKPEA